MTTSRRHFPCDDEQFNGFRTFFQHLIDNSGLEVIVSDKSYYYAKMSSVDGKS